MPRIVITAHKGPVRVLVGDRVLVATNHAMQLVEGSAPTVWYVPRADADMALLERTSHRTHCPFKGDASYFSILGGAGKIENAVWSYEHPLDGALAIKDHLAFYPRHVTIEA